MIINNNDTILCMYIYIWQFFWGQGYRNKTGSSDAIFGRVLNIVGKQVCTKFD